MLRKAIAGFVLLLSIPAHGAPQAGAGLRFFFADSLIDMQLAVENPTDRSICLSRRVSIHDALIFSKTGTRVFIAEGHDLKDSSDDRTVTKHGGANFDSIVELAALTEGEKTLGHIARVRYANSLVDCRTHRTILDLTFDQKFALSPWPAP